MTPSTVTEPAPKATRLFAIVPPAPGVNSVLTTPTLGIPVSRDGSDVAGSYQHHLSRQMSPATSTFRCDIPSRIWSGVIGLFPLSFARAPEKSRGVHPGR